MCRIKHHVCGLRRYLLCSVGIFTFNVINKRNLFLDSLFGSKNINYRRHQASQRIIEVESVVTCYCSYPCSKLIVQYHIEYT